MTEEQVGAGMYELGYRIRVILGHMVDGEFQRDKEIMPLYVKHLMEVGPLLRTVYKDHVCQSHYIREDGTKDTGEPQMQHTQDTDK